MRAAFSRPAAAGAAALLFSLAVFFWFAGDGLAAYFTPDDMMNLYDSWQRPWVTGRLAGTLFYNLEYRLFGFQPAGYRIACFALLVLNLGLLYGFALRLSRSHGTAALACLLGAYHAHLADLYYSTGTVYDLLCFTFLFGAFVWHASIRERGAVPDWKQTALILLLYGAAVESKEMAISFVPMLVLYELLYRRGDRDRRRWRVAGLAATATIAFVISKLSGPGSMSANPAYAMHFSFAVWAENWRNYLNDLLYQAIAFTPATVVAFWAILLAAALTARRRDVLFAWCLMFFGALPVLFIAQRGLYALYVIIPGCCLYAAGLIDRLLPCRLPRRHAVAFALLAAALIPLHAREKQPGKAWVQEAFDSIRLLREQLRDRYPAMPSGARVLFLNDPYPEDDYIVTFIFILNYRDPAIQVDRVRQKGYKPKPPETYRYIFTMEGWKLVEKASNPSPAAL